MLFGDRVVCSTGDLVTAARCEFALLRALDAELGLVAPVDVQSPGALTRTPIRPSSTAWPICATATARLSPASAYPGPPPTPSKAPRLSPRNCASAP